MFLGKSLVVPDNVKTSWIFFQHFIAATQLMEYNELETGSAHPPDGNENKIIWKIKIIGKQVIALAWRNNEYSDALKINVLSSDWIIVIIAANKAFILWYK